MSNSVLGVVVQEPWKQARNQREAATLARIIDFFVDQYGEHALRTSDAMEVACRRLLAVTAADQTGNWTLAAGYEELPTRALPGPVKLQRAAQLYAKSVPEVRQERDGRRSAYQEGASNKRQKGNPRQNNVVVTQDGTRSFAGAQ
jgi:hypothetical protein